MMPPDDDEEGNAGDLLDMLSGEVGEYGGRGLGIEEPEEKGGPQKLLTLEISITPGGGAAAEPFEGKETPEEEEAEAASGHDPVAHELGLCKGGCPY